MAFPSPAVTPPSLSTWQASFNGLTIGLGTPFAIDKITGLDLPALRSGDVVRQRDHGQLIGLDLLAARDIVIEGDVVSDGTSLQHALVNLATATTPGGSTEQP